MAKDTKVKKTPEERAAQREKKLSAMSPEDRKAKEERMAEKRVKKNARKAAKGEGGA